MNEKIQKVGTKNISTTGRFVLEVLRDKRTFRVTNINAFVPNGKTVAEKLQFKNSSGLVDYVMIDRITQTLDPKSDIDHHNICVLIQHPDVRIASMSDKEHADLAKLRIKKPNPKFKLTNIDLFEDEKHNDSVKLLKVRARIYDEEKPISKRTLMYICSTLGIPYKSDITEENKLVIFLQKQVDKYVQKGEENIKNFNNIFENINRAEKVYYINELIERQIVTESGGIYKVKDIPVGVDLESVIRYFDANFETFNMYKKIVIEETQGTIYQ